MAHLIIDGYNLIRQISALIDEETKSLEQGRLALIRKLAHYKQVQGHRITVVFDAMHSDNFYMNEEKMGGIQILYSEMLQSADTVIIKLAQAERDGAIIVSSDNEIRHAAEKFGCGLLTSPEFYQKLEQAQRYSTSMDTRDSEPAKPLHKRFLTKKKGPAKRLPKAKRKALRDL